MNRKVAVFLLCLGALMSWSFYRKLTEARQYEQGRDRIEAPIVEKKMIPASRGGPHETQYRVYYLFQGNTIPLSVDAERFESLRVGATIPLIHLPGQPQTARPVYDLQLEDPAGDAVLGLLFTAGGVIVWWRSARRKPKTSP